jgi:hypothetical protein
MGKKIEALVLLVQMFATVLRRLIKCKYARLSKE